MTEPHSLAAYYHMRNFDSGYVLGTLPPEKQGLYTELAEKAPEALSMHVLEEILRVGSTSRSRLATRIDKAIGQLNLSADGEPDFDVLVDWVVERVREMRPWIDRRRAGNGKDLIYTTLNECEVYVNCALGAFIIKQLGSALIRWRKRQPVRCTHLLALTILREEVKKWVRGLGISEKVQHKIPKDVQEHSTTNSWSSIPTQELAATMDKAMVLLREVRDRLPQASESAITSTAEQQSTMQICQPSSLASLGALSGVADTSRLASDNCEERLQQSLDRCTRLEQENQILKFDNAALGFNLATLRSVAIGDQAGLKAKLLCKQLSKDILNRLIQNSAFQRKFMPSSRKRKRDVEDQSIKIEDN